MTLANGRSYLAIPGPSVVPDRVLQAMHRASPDIYKGALVDMMPGLVDDLKRVVRTCHNVAIYIANGHGAWEAAIANTLAPGDKVLVLASGAFGHGWAEIATRLGVEAEVLEFGRFAPYDPARVARRLSEDKAHQIKAVMVVHVDTSTSVKSDVAALRVLMDDARHPALLMVDCIASLACDRFEMDDWGVDVTVAACQKGLMVPTGVSFVFFNEKATQLRENRSSVSWYWDWENRAKPADFYRYFGGTAPTHHLYGLRESLDMIHEEGLENVWQRHERLANAYWAAIDCWSAEGPVQLNVSEPAHRSHAVTAVNIDAPDGARLRDWVQRQMGVTLGISLGMDDDLEGDAAFRIGHMGHVNGHMVLGTIGTIEAGLLALGVAHGAGGLQAATQICARP